MSVASLPRDENPPVSSRVRRGGRYWGTLYAGSGNPSMGLGLERDAIAVVVIGGTRLAGGRGDVLGTLLGRLIVGTIQAAIRVDGRLSAWWMRRGVGGRLLGFILLQRFFIRGAARRG